MLVRNIKRNIEEGKRQLGLEGHEEKEWKQIGRVDELCVIYIEGKQGGTIWEKEEKRE